jgi:hypothetical protein
MTVTSTHPVQVWKQPDFLKIPAGTIPAVIFFKTIVTLKEVITKILL